MEWIVLRDGKLWTDGFTTKEEAERHVEEECERYSESLEIKCVEMDVLDTYYEQN